MTENSIYNRAEKKVDEKIRFYRHLFSYVVVISLLFIVNYLFTPEYLWVLCVALFWGLGVLFNFLKVFIIYEKFDDLYRDKMIEKEMEKMKN